MAKRREVTEQELSKAYVLRYLHIAKLFIKNANRTAHRICEGGLSGIDPIVGENSCQIRGLHAIDSYNDPAIQKEAEELRKATKKMLANIVHALNKKLPIIDYTMPLEDILEELGMNLKTSEKMNYILRSHLLTIGKFFVVLQNGKEISGIDANRIRLQLSSRLHNNIIRAIVHVSRERIAEATIPYIQGEAAKVTEKTDPHARHVGPVHPHR